jgi:hypothetical protein
MQQLSANVGLATNASAAFQRSGEGRPAGHLRFSYHFGLTDLPTFSTRFHRCRHNGPGRFQRDLSAKNLECLGAGRRSEGEV